MNSVLPRRSHVWRRPSGRRLVPPRGNSGSAGKAQVGVTIRRQRDRDADNTKEAERSTTSARRDGSTSAEDVPTALLRKAFVNVGTARPGGSQPSIGSMPTAVVTGGAGFLGSHLCEALVEQGHRVICVDNLETGSLQNVEHLRGDRFAFINHDVTEHLAIDEPVDFVYHLASPASPIDYLRLPLATLKVGSYGTHNALGLAKWKRARFLLASTSEVYGDPHIHPQPETYWGNVNPIGPRGVYDEAKRYAEALTMAYHRQQGVDTRIVRIFNTYGPRMRPHDGRAIPTFVRQAQDNDPLTVFGDGSQTRSFCYVDDLIRGLIALAGSGEHLPVNIGNPTSTFCNELAGEGRRCHAAPRARSCSRRSRSTIRRSASRTSPGPGSCSAGSRGQLSRTVSGDCWKRTQWESLSV